MLKQRVITGLLLLAIIVSVLFLLPSSVLVYSLYLVFAVAAWEWSNLAAVQTQVLRILFTLFIIAMISGLVFYVNIGIDQKLLPGIRDIVGAGCLWWAIALIWVMQYPGSKIYWHYRPVKLLMGIFVLVPSAVSLVYLSSLSAGNWVLLYVIGIVVAADVGAYFTGKKWGSLKLAPHVSPGKSWAGFWGGLVTAIVLAVVVGSQYSVAGLSLQALVVVTVFSALASVLGDLLESMLKRDRGIKDSSQLLPGHGGFLDRIDSITAAAPVFTLLLLLLQAVK